MRSDNADQIAEWNGVQGEGWAAMTQQTEHIVLPFGAAAMAVAAPQPGERAIDVGCGCGDTAIELARRHSIKLPICEAVYQTVNGEASAADAYAGLRRTQPGHEFDPDPHPA